MIKFNTERHLKLDTDAIAVQLYDQVQTIILEKTNGTPAVMNVYDVADICGKLTSFLLASCLNAAYSTRTEVGASDEETAKALSRVEEIFEKCLKDGLETAPGIFMNLQKK